jgi:hypothetical protein
LTGNTSVVVDNITDITQPTKVDKLPLAITVSMKAITMVVPILIKTFTAVILFTCQGKRTTRSLFMRD